jgi:hypothetical protein
MFPDKKVVGCLRRFLRSLLSGLDRRGIVLLGRVGGGDFGGFELALVAYKLALKLLYGPGQVSIIRVALRRYKRFAKRLAGQRDILPGGVQVILEKVHCNISK